MNAKRRVRLTERQRTLLLALDGEWRTLDAIYERMREQAWKDGRRPSLKAKGAVENTLLDQLGDVIDYRGAGSLLAPAQSGRLRVEMYRLNEGGELLQSEARLVRKAGLG